LYELSPKVRANRLRLKIDASVTNIKMTDPSFEQNGKHKTIAERLKHSDPQKYARLKAEARAPYRGLRKFIYVTLAAWGGIGAVVFFTALLAGKGDTNTNLSSLALQLGLVGLMIFLFRRDRPSQPKQKD
jgi:hypothetical protein